LFSSPVAFTDQPSWTSFPSLPPSRPHGAGQDGLYSFFCKGVTRPQKHPSPFLFPVILLTQEGNPALPPPFFCTRCLHSHPLSFFPFPFFSPHVQMRRRNCPPSFSSEREKLYYSDVWTDPSFLSFFPRFSVLQRVRRSFSSSPPEQRLSRIFGGPSPLPLPSLPPSLALGLPRQTIESKGKVLRSPPPCPRRAAATRRTPPLSLPLFFSAGPLDRTKTPSLLGDPGRSSFLSFFSFLPPVPFPPDANGNPTVVNVGPY